MLIGRNVLVYRTGDEFNAPIPAIISRDNGGNSVDVNAFESGMGDGPPFVAFCDVRFCKTAKEAAKAFADDAQFVCHEYDPRNPVAFEAPEPEPVEEEAPRAPVSNRPNRVTRARAAK